MWIGCKQVHTGKIGKKCVWDDKGGLKQKSSGLMNLRYKRICKESLENWYKKLI